jgi:hypothetical protein
MSGSPIQKFLLTPAVISASVFAALTLPLAVLGNKPVTIQLQNESVFYGQLRDVATPYLGLASVLSLGAGVASVAVAGWRQSSRKSSEVEAQLSGLTQNLKEKEAQLEALKLSESRIEASGLKAFLDEEVPLEAQQMTELSSVSRPPIIEEFAIASPVLEASVAVQPVITVQEAAAKFACAQTFLGYAQGKAIQKPETGVNETDLTQEVEQLQAQLQQIMAQMASVQSALTASRQVGKSETAEPDKVAPLQAAKSWSVHQMAS